MAGLEAGFAFFYQRSATGRSPNQESIRIRQSFMRRLCLLTLTLLLLAGLGWTATAEPDTNRTAKKVILPKLNQKVVHFANARKGKKVGNGECWTLADQALKSAGAKRPGRDDLGNYAFGRRLGSKETLRPGDILQFEKAEFVHRGENRWSRQSFPHHTAIVYRVSGSKLTLLHQNVNGKRTVQMTTLDLSERTKGTVTGYRPQARKKHR